MTSPTDGELTVSRVSNSATYPFLIERHYAKRIPSLSHCFGLFRNNELIGVVTYGTPPSAPQRTGLLGPDMAGVVLELNRLCLKYNRKNEASFLVSQSLKMIPRPSAIISYADTAQGHIGTVYQATNALYLGLSAKRTDWCLKSKPGVHGLTVADEFRGMGNRAKLMREKYGSDFYLAERPRKHRYLFLVGSRKDKKQMLSALRYQIEGYPKKEAK